MKDSDYILSKNLLKKINIASDIINKQSRNNQGNYMIVNSEIAEILNVMNEEQRIKEKQELRLKKLKRLLEEL